MNNFLLVHIGDSLPSFLKTCIRQIQSTNKNADIILATNLNVEAPGINCVNINKLQLKDTGSYFQYNPDPLWITSLKRIFIIDHIMQKFNLKNTVDIDNDVLVFNNIDEIKDKLIEPLYITPHKKTEFTFGFSFARESDAFSLLSENIYKLIMFGENEVKKLTGDETHEMRLLGYTNNGNITPLPIHPKIGQPINNFIFDPSSYGQYLDGTPSGHLPGFIDPLQIVGSIFKDENPEILFINKKPILKYNNKIYNIFNLHIHSKQLSKYEI